MAISMLCWYSSIWGAIGMINWNMNWFYRYMICRYSETPCENSFEMSIVQLKSIPALPPWWHQHHLRQLASHPVETDWISAWPPHQKVWRCSLHPDETWSADRGWSKIITEVDLAAQNTFRVGKTGCQSGKNSFFWTVAIYHLWSTFISLIPHNIIKPAKSNQFSGVFVAQNLFLSF